jgi:TetR/AcrR family transcriptional regulator, transcriptional repressor for nem operon
MPNTGPSTSALDLDPLARAQAVLGQAGERSSRDRLLDSAMQLFHERGYHATGITAVLDHSGVSSGSLYHYFPTKEHLAAALLERYSEWLEPMLFAPVRARVDDPIERVFLLLEGYRQQLIASEFRLGCPIGNLGLELSETNPLLRDGIARNFRAWRDAVAACFEAARGRMQERTDPRALAVLTLALMEGAVMQARVERSLEPFEVCVAELRRYVEMLLAAESGAPSSSRQRR